MSAVAGPVFAVAAVMGVAGVLKLAQPETAARAMKAAGLPDSPLAVRLLAVTEIVVAAAEIAFGNRLTAALVAVYYLAFAGFAALLLRRSGTAPDCGCFGTTEQPSPTTWLHVVMNLLAAGFAALAVAWPTGGLLDVLADQPLLGLPFLLLTGLCGWLWYAVLTLLPTLLTTAQRRPQPT
jgi:hypothetical protein